MGTWGTAISSNDTYQDVYWTFMEWFDQGLEIPEITQRIIEDYNHLQEDYEEGHDFWFALAMAQWQCKALDQEIYDNVRRIIENGENIKLWEDLGAEKEELLEREGALEAFLKKISHEKAKPKMKKKKVLQDSVFNTGDCLTFQMGKGNFGGAFVLYSEKQTESGMNLIGLNY